MKIGTGAVLTEDSVRVDLAASVIVDREDGEPIDAEEARRLVEALSGKVGEFIEACAEENYFACGNAGQVGLRTPECHPDDRATDKPFPTTLESEEEIEAREQEGAEEEAAEGREQELREQEREQEEVEQGEEGRAVDSKTCTACHAKTTQLDANQCPMCGNPFQP